MEESLSKEWQDNKSDPSLSERENPLKLLKSINKTQFITFFVTYLSWTFVSFDYFIVTFTLPYIAKDFKLKPSDVAVSITLMLTFRPLGALIFGLLSDKYGRKYPLMANIFIFSGLQLASGFAPNFLTYSITRAIFGMAMGGEWGLGAALAMEALPLESRGLLSGILQEGYALGFLLAAVVYYAVITNWGWRTTYYIGSFPILLVLIIYFLVPESEEWKRLHAERKTTKINPREKTRSIIINHWKIFLFSILLMTALNFIVHGSKDLYPTFLNVQLDFTPGQITFITIIANIGSIIGGFINGYICHFLGRKNAMITFTFLAGCFLPLYVLPRNYIVLTIGAFAVYLCIGGSWGSIPAYLNEIAPVELRGTFPGLVYQTGTLLASSSAQIEAFFGEMIKEEGSPDYGLTIALLTSLFVIVIIIILKFTNNV
ncbi:MFS general substrate transporter [Rhizophagus irregularis]|uniref:Major facilitator superfamily domain-containing protein n=3 Tax=Rhizophagus irregularis TaxID=588596 RepID=U9UMK0_RHIID|nr:major facilitator superfamily domain-containing protein [Rhizophagus irregularis DAOM 181602=DAOM 197198]AIY62318.1 monosaccharide transporter 6 [Rhizophagus irregularis]PKC03222.1 MFS general substrate transporter [Rhizophagus irregularis]PKC60092.1 MFS general substrate transporter [Rhizophagus irregularis]PKK73194.1 MFS general substrate transporter [Rhizophagus irregularis]PKY28051.1 MFS general substrate transporter [Rhizophagus irregularis]|eukprot:XP_025187988.1 major facilitator superfamily domain-containing protein [Rhizophagus irregularis DAOM 181602=DAOM 197198]